MTVGSIVKHHNCIYVVVHKNGTLEKLSKPRWFRILCWEFRNIFKPFKAVQETKDFLYKR